MSANPTATTTYTATYGFILRGQGGTILAAEDGHLTASLAMEAANRAARREERVYGLTNLTSEIISTATIVTTIDNLSHN